MPAIISIIFPVIAGFLFGPYFVGGLLIGATLSAIMLAIFTGNAGGAWDNGKKYIESGAIEGQGKGSPAHDAAVVGDTVGDPLKDTVGPSLDILIKIMSTVSLVAAVMFYKYNLLYQMCIRDRYNTQDFLSVSRNYRLFLEVAHIHLFLHQMYLCRTS